MGHRSHKIGCVWKPRPGFLKSSHIFSGEYIYIYIYIYISMITMASILNFQIDISRNTKCDGFHKSSQNYYFLCNAICGNQFSNSLLRFRIVPCRSMFHHLLCIAIATSNNYLIALLE